MRKLFFAAIFLQIGWSKPKTNASNLHAVASFSIIPDLFPFPDRVNGIPEYESHPFLARNLAHS